MTTAAPYNMQRNTTEAPLFVACELSEKAWKLGFTTGHGQQPRERTVTARQQERWTESLNAFFPSGYPRNCRRWRQTLSSGNRSNTPPRSARRLPAPLPRSTT